MTCPDCVDVTVDRDQWRRLALTLQQAHPQGDALDPFLWRIWQHNATRHQAQADALGTRLALAERALRTQDPAHIAAWRNHPPLEDDHT